MNYPLIRNILFKLDAELAHNLALNALKTMHALRGATKLMPPTCSAPVKIWGKTFPNSVGLAAGLDKNADYAAALADIGFGFIEVGTVTPRPQKGNPKPRLFRLEQDMAIINRFGFNSKGVEYLQQKVAKYNNKALLGINIGKNKTTSNQRAVDDYLHCQQMVYAYADYITVNISSPNTPDLRQLQNKEELNALLEPLKNQQQQLAGEYKKLVPLVVKVAPDLEPAQITTIANVCTELEIDGLICTNTTIKRDGLRPHRHQQQAGGLSGAPLFEQSNAILKQFRQALGSKMPIIGVGGINSAADAVAKIKAGADLVQIYTGFVYRGPQLVHDCATAIARLK